MNDAFLYCPDRLNVRQASSCDQEEVERLLSEGWTVETVIV